MLDTDADRPRSEASVASEPAAAPTRLGSARLGLAAFAAYAVTSFAFFGLRVAGRVSTAFVGRGGGDSNIYLWDLRWWPYALTHGLNPFTPHVIFVPQGINLAWATGLPGPALVMWPITGRFGAVASSNVLSVLSPAVAAWAAYLVCHRLVEGRFWPAFLGGYLFGFSTYEIAELRGHVNLFLVFPVALAVYLVVRFVQGSIGRRAFVGLLAITLVGEFSISTEVFASMTFFGAVVLGIAWWRARDARPRLKRALALIGAAYLAAAAVLAPYLYYVVTAFPGGPLKPVASGSSSVDLLSFVIPRVGTLIGGQAFHRETGAFLANNSEDGAYLSPALIALLLIALHERRRADPVLRLAAVVIAIASTAALGAWLHVDGHAVIPMPWLPFTAVPGLQDALPQRFMVYGWLAIAVVLARWLAATTEDHLSTGTIWRYGFVVLACVLLLPNVFEPKQPVPAEPAFFAQGIYRGEISPGAIVLLIHPSKGQDMAWQEETGFWFSMAEGHIGTEPESYRSDPAWLAIRNDDPGDVSSKDFGAFVRSHGVTEVLVAHSIARRWRATVEGALGVKPVRIGGVAVYRPAPGRGTF